jgi:hypothetical protein
MTKKYDDNVIASAQRERGNLGFYNCDRFSKPQEMQLQQD